MDEGNHKMKKLILGSLLVAGSSAALAMGPAGCGLGTAVVFKNPTTWVEHVLAATTNGTSGNQTFGMTSGTLGCEAAGGPLASGVDYFIDENIDLIAMESANGQGETIQALAEMIGVQDQDTGLFTASMQQHFDTLFPSADTSSAEVYDAIVAMMRTDIRLAKYLA